MTAASRHTSKTIRNTTRIACNIPLLQSFMMAITVFRCLPSTVIFSHRSLRNDLCRSKLVNAHVLTVNEDRRRRPSDSVAAAATVPVTDSDCYWAVSPSAAAAAAGMQTLPRPPVTITIMMPGPAGRSDRRWAGFRDCR